MRLALVTHLAEKLAENRRLRGVPHPVIEECILQTFSELEYVEMEDGLTVQQLLGDVGLCDECSKLCPGDKLVTISEDRSVCQVCAQAAAPTPAAKA